MVARRLSRTAAFVAAIAVIVFAVVFVSSRHGRSRGPASPQRPSAPAVSEAVLQMTPQGRLLTLANRISAVAPEEAGGPYEYTHVQVWTRAGDMVAVLEIRRWRAENGSGRVIQRRAPDRPYAAGMPTAADVTALATAPVR